VRIEYFFFTQKKTQMSPTAFQIYYEHWGRENNRQRKCEYIVCQTKRLLSKVYSYVVLYIDFDPRITYTSRWGYLDPEAADFWQQMEFVEKELQGFPRPYNQRNLEIFANLLFPLECPVILQREDVGSLWEHAYRSRRRFCLRNGMDLANAVKYSTPTLHRVDAIVALS